jgi:ABC-2 type transport system ATP-binding protein
MKKPAIQTESLIRDFKSIRAVDSLNLTINQGELFGLVGPDGAGKTTTLRILAGLLEITGGSAYVSNHNINREPEAIKTKIGYMAQQFSLYAELSVLENIRFFADLYDVPPDGLNQRIERLLSFAGLLNFKTRWAGRLSGGMQKKLALACTLIHQPPILLLDEPTTGVDPISRREFWNILGDLHIDGTTIVVSTPYMDEADRCSRVGLMYNGKLIECAPPEEIRSKIKGDLIKVLPLDWQTTRRFLRTFPGVLEVQTYGEAIHVLVDSSEKRLDQIKNALQDEGLPYKNARTTPLRMEEAFISLIRKHEEKNKEMRS